MAVFVTTSEQCLNCRPLFAISFLKLLLHKKIKSHKQQAKPTNKDKQETTTTETNLWPNNGYGQLDKPVYTHILVYVLYLYM